jgi:hypothetical protein
MNLSGQPVSVLSKITGYSSEFVSKMIQRELCNASKTVSKAQKMSVIQTEKKET